LVALVFKQPSATMDNHHSRSWVYGILPKAILYRKAQNKELAASS
jgi:hypothetical protein